ncbi:MAG: sulfatase-like hydrolase/transferase [Myxococcota bacterium]|nr:sulfatase-like hydrolase/transferase [Myxococcota bacterium]
MTALAPMLRLHWSAACAALVVAMFDVIYALSFGQMDMTGMRQTMGVIAGIIGVIGLPIWGLGLVGLTCLALIKRTWRWCEPQPPTLAQWIARSLTLLVGAAAVFLGGYLGARYGIKHFRKPVYMGLSAGLGGVVGGVLVGGLSGPLLALHHMIVVRLSRCLPPALNLTRPWILRYWVLGLGAGVLFLAPVIITPLHTVDLRGLRLVCLFLVALEIFYHRPIVANLRPRLFATGALSLMFITTFLWASLSLGHDPTRVLSIERDTILTGPVLSIVERMADGDGDGVSGLFSGGDCDDEDPTIRPGVYDAPNDGIDQNCTGADFSPQPPVPRAQSTRGSQKAKDWNVVLITVDALRADVVSTLMPRIDTFAKNGIAFESGYSHGATTYWSLPALLASKMPSQVHMGRDQTPVNDELLLTEVLKSHGWHTALFANVTIFFIRGLRQGFQKTSYDTSHYTVHGAKPGSRHMTDSVLRYVDRWRAGKARTVRKKLFLWAHYYDPHEPYFKVPDFPAQGTDDRSRYDAIVRSVDAQIGRLLDGFKQRGLWDNTLFIITADHGEEFGDHGHRHHGRSVYDEVTRVPLIMKVPGLSPMRETAPMGHIDLAPTVLDLLQLPIPKQYRGQSRVPRLFARPKSETEPVFLEVFPDTNYNAHLVAMRLGRYKLIYRVQRHYFELYDLEADPAERRNLMASAPEASALKERLMTYVDQHLYDLAQGRTGAKKPRGSPGKKPKKKR